MQWYFILLIVLGSLFLLMSALFIFLTAGKSGKALGRLGSVNYAHRGLHGTVGGYDTYAAENSLTAFARAKEQGFGIELDVRLTKDGSLVVFHDDTLDRVCGISGRVDALTLSELSEARLSGTDDTVPTFAEVLALIGGEVPLLIELKGESMSAEVADATARVLLGYEGEYIIESFNPVLLGRIKKLLPEAKRGFLLSKHTSDPKHRSLKYRIIQRCLLNFIARPHFIALDKSHPRLFPAPLVIKLFGTAKIAWTVRSTEEEEKAYRDGFSAVIFEKYLSGRGKSR
ncbi:MAG: glycerophosphodiester phosphodiesterase [Clostridia bacterium]|nr:glycerophosphodiester phosphodiesterase [Clostridia bacterium]